MILHYDGNDWSLVNGAFGNYLNGIWVELNGDVVAVGDGPVIMERDGGEWTETHVPVGSASFTDVLGVGKIIVAVGTGGLVAVRRNGEWYIQRGPSNSTLTALWAFDEKNIYAASREHNVILFFDGTKWTKMNIAGPSLPGMTDIWGTSPNNLFLLDYNGTIAHFDGHRWNAEERVILEQMETLCGNGREVIAAGRLGSVSYRR
jgi:hypothetical protein